MAKALVFSDLHLHSHKDKVDRLQDCLNVLDWVFRVAVERKVDYIFFLGDLFHERIKIDTMNYIRTFEVFMKHLIEDAANIDVYLLVGNHDMYHKERWDVNSVKPLNAIPRVTVIQKPTQIELGGRKIDWLPHTDNPIKELNKMKKEGIGDILFSHLAVNGATLNVCYGTKADVIVEYDNEMVAVDSNIFDDWKLTMLGHYHGAQQLSPTAEYVGSPLELTFGEAFQQKHLIILDLETLEKEYVVNDFSPKHLIVTPQDIQHECYSLDGNFIRVAIDSLSSKEVIDLKRSITQNHKVLSLDTKKKEKEKKTEEDQTVIESARAILLNIQQMLETYIQERGVPDGIDKAKLLSKGQLFLQKNDS